MRPDFIFALLLLAVPALAAPPAPEKASQFLDKTLVTYPRKVQEIALKSAEYDAEQLLAGVSLNYRVPGLPDGSALSIFVFPHGRSEQEAGLKRALADITDGVLGEQRNHAYQDVVLGEVQEFSVAAHPATVIGMVEAGREQPVVISNAASAPDASDASEASSTANSDDAIAAAARAAEAPTTTLGRKLKISFSHKGVPMQSIGYAFYRNLFLITVRFSSPAAGLSPERFEAMGDEAVRVLVPSIDIQNFGNCGTMVVDLPEKEEAEDDSSRAGAISLIREMGRIARENCAASEGNHPSPLPADHGRTELVYPNGMWD
jgi:hypothetical protein